MERWLAWERVSREVAEGVLGTEFDRADHNELRSKVKDAETAAGDEVWGGYRFVALSDARADSRIKCIDLGAGHSSASETLCGRVVTALRSEALLSESVGAGYLDRHWPPAFKETGAWPLTGLRQSFLNGSLTRLIALKHPLVLQDGEHSLVQPVLVQHCGEFVEQWPQSLRGPVGNMFIKHEPLAKQ